MGKAPWPGAVAIALGGMAGADIVSVPADYPTIQTAIVAAQPGDEVVVAPGTYPEAIDFLGKAITVRSSGGSDVTTIDASRIPGTAVRAASDESPDTVFQGFTVTGGTAIEGSSETPWGGGMYIFSSDITVTDCVFTGNVAGLGGGMSIGASSSAIDNSVFDDNSAEQGGGLFVIGSSLRVPVLTDCTFSNNHATEDGGGMLCSGHP
ncbi:MAG: right-handed parallel beta-helix repeat-containing protein, partial [Planctomycetota bacterium]